LKNVQYVEKNFLYIQKNIIGILKYIKQKTNKERNILQSCILSFSNQLHYPQKTSLEEETNTLFIVYKNNFGQRKTKRQLLNYLIGLKDKIK